MFAGIAGFFLLMLALDMEDRSEMRLLNVLIVALFSFLMARRISKDEEEFNYLNTMFRVFAANAIAVILTVVGLVVYVRGIDPSFAENFNYWVMFAGEKTLLSVAGALFIEGTSGAVIISLIVMQYYQYAKSSEKKLKVHKTQKNVA
jgi:preprotein translocase subunit YajC